MVESSCYFFKEEIFLAEARRVWNWIFNKLLFFSFLYFGRFLWTENWFALIATKWFSWLQAYHFGMMLYHFFFSRSTPLKYYIMDFVYKLWHLIRILLDISSFYTFRNEFLHDLNLNISMNFGRIPCVLDGEEKTLWHEFK